jgi:DNA-binding NtrC family response regulator
VANPAVLLISTDEALITAVEETVTRVGCLQLCVLDEVDEVSVYLRASEAALVLVHLASDEDTGRVIDLLRNIATAGQSLATIVLSDSQHETDALTLLRQGVADYLNRPLDLNRLLYLVDFLTVRARVGRATAATNPPVAALGTAQAFLYNPMTAMGQVLEQVKRVAVQDTTILLGGETGTGKTSLARVIHELSPRRGEPFLVVNCGSLSASLIESELFGHSKGAFTGADRDRIGKCADVGGGTLLLDEVDALPLAQQAKLLRVVDERLFEPVGSNKPVRMDARIIVATSRNLEHEVAAGRFRSDLYYRLNVVGFHLPPLRERRHVIHALVEKYLGDFAARNDRPVQAIARAALQALEEYDWPGNIRELRNVIERAVALCPGAQIGLEDLPDALRRDRPHNGVALTPSPARLGPTEAGTLVRTKEAAEAQRIVAALQKHNNNRQRAAAELGISRMTLYKKLHRYGLMPVS